MNQHAPSRFRVPAEIEALLFNLPGPEHRTFRHQCRVAVATILEWGEHKTLAIPARTDAEEAVVRELGALLNRLMETK